MNLPSIRFHFQISIWTLLLAATICTTDLLAATIQDVDAAGPLQPIFNGKDFDGWKHNGNWSVVDGVISRTGKGGPLTYTNAKVPDNFELRFEWKVASGSNSGIYYRPGQVEYQILDNQTHKDGKNPRTSAASLYFCMPPAKDATRPVGEWNSGRIVCQGSVIQHWLNGVKVVDFDYRDKQWNAEVELLNKRGGDLEARGGNLWLQDHGDPVWYRNLAWRSLGPDEDIGHSDVQPAAIPAAAQAAEQQKIKNILESRKRQEAKQADESKAKDRPNVLLIVVDDQSPFDLQMYNPRSTLDTPTLDRLARRGVVIDGAHQMGAWVGAVCTCSRHMIMSGRTLWHIPDRNYGKQRNRPSHNPNIGNESLVPPNLVESTLPAIFNRAGYDTMRTCKTGNSYDAANKQFQVVRDAMKRGGTDQTGSAWHAEQVLDYLDDRVQRNDEDPFLIYFGFSHPHDVRDGKPELLAKYGAVNHRDKDQLPPSNPKQPVLPINYLPEHPFHHGHPNLRDEVNVSGVWRNRDTQTIRNELGREYACSENIDIQIDRVLKKLEQMGELENTFVIYTADHGMAIGRHGLQGKQNLYEHTFRVPMIVAGPELPAGKRVQGNVYLLDLLATICDMTKVEVPDTNEGISFLPVVRGQQKVVRDTLYGAYCGGTKPGMRCVKQGDWKLIKYDVMDSQVQETQLFNLKQNPHEFITQHQEPRVVELIGSKPDADQINLANDPQYKQKLEEMEALLLEQMTLHHDPYRFWDQPQGR